MPIDYESFPRGGVAVCARCGRRPGTVRAVVATRNGPTPMPLCEQCAHELMAGGAAVAPADAPGRARGGGQQSATPPLDEVGRDLTREGPAGRLDPGVGPARGVEQTVEIPARR